MNPYRPFKIISGGQTGADQGGLFGAELCGIPTGGWSPRGYRTEMGSQINLLMNRFRLHEHESDKYPPRTEANIIDSDVTLIFAGDILSTGTHLTYDLCLRKNKECLTIDMEYPEVSYIKDFLMATLPEIINIAGNRESVSPGICNKVRDIIVEVFK